MAVFSGSLKGRCARVQCCICRLSALSRARDGIKASRYICRIRILAKSLSFPEVGNNFLQLFPDGYALWTLFLAFSAFQTLGRKSRASECSNPSVVELGNVRRIEHTSLVVKLKTFRNADIGRTWHAVSATCAGYLHSPFVFGLCLTE